MTGILEEIESAINESDKMYLKDILENMPPRKNNPYIQWLIIGCMCYGNITLGEYKGKMKCQSQQH